MLFVLNGWDDLTKDAFHSLPVSLTSSKPTVFRNTVMHIREGKTMKGFGSGCVILEAVTLHQKASLSWQKYRMVPLLPKSVGSCH